MAQQTDAGFDTGDFADPFVMDQKLMQDPVFTDDRYGSLAFMVKLEKNHEDASFWLFVMGFFIFVSWPISWALHRRSPSEKAQRWAKMAGIAAIIVAVLYVIGVILMTATMSLLPLLLPSSPSDSGRD